MRLTHKILLSEDPDARLAAVEAMEAMRLPVGPVEQMIAESVADPQDLAD